MNKNNSWDYIVVGAGHNGLSAACILAKAGKSVLVVDQRDIIGGLANSHAYVEEAPRHILSLGAMDVAFFALADELNLAQYGYKTAPLEQPYGWMNEDGDSLVLFPDFDRTVKDIQYFSPKDAQKYIEIRSTLDFLAGMMEKMIQSPPDEMPKFSMAGSLLKLVGDKNIRKNLARMLSVSCFEMIAETFESDAMRGLWAFWCSMSTTPTTPGTGAFISAYAGVHGGGICRPVGGMNTLVSALAKFLGAHGGEIRLNSKVEQILVSAQNRATGIRLVNGEELQASRGVLANCAPQVALGQLLADDILDKTTKDRIKFMPANSIGVAPFKIDIAAGGRLSFPKALQKRAQRDGIDLRKTTFMTGTLEQHIAQHEACLRGESVAFEPPLFFSILSGAESSVAPEGGDVLYLYANSPVKPVGGWAAQKNVYAQQIMQALPKYISGLDSEIGRVVTCADDFIEKFSAPNGSYFHVDLQITRMGMNRPAPGLGGYKTPVDGLFLAGAGTHPFGGVSGLPGKLSAECVLKNEQHMSNI